MQADENTIRLDYNTEMEKLRMPEYGRNVRRMVSQVKQIEDRAKRTEQAYAVVKVMARKYTGNKTNEYSIADLTVDTAAKTVVRSGKTIELTSKEFALLEYMIRNRGVVLSREMIEDNLWNFDYEGGTNVVDVYIGYLRRKIDKGFDKKLIHTVRGTGWVLREDD